MYGLTLILVLAFVGGIIAYIGDKIGMKVGRKRLTLFGLRPKHTSILITICTGIFIAASSITVLSIVSQDVRTALFQMKSIQEALAVSQTQLEESRVHFEEMENSLQSMERERDRASEELQSAQAEKEAVKLEYEQLVSDLDSTRQELEVNRERVEEFREMIERLETRRAELEEGVVYLLDQYENLWEQYLKFEDYMRGGDLLFRADEIIFAQVFEAGGSLEAVTENLMEFLRQADRIALNRGARSDEDGEFALALTQQTLDMAAHSLHLQDGYYVVRAISKSNTLVNEPVATYLELIPNEVLFSKGSVIADTVVDLDSHPDIDEAIMKVIGEANQSAIRAGMITQEGAAVEVAGDSFLNALAAARQYSGTVRVEVVVLEDTWAAFGPMRLAIQVRPVEG